MLSGANTIKRKNNYKHHMKIKKRMNLKNINRILYNRLNIVKKAFVRYEEPYTEISQNARKFFIKIKLPDVKKKDLFLKVNKNTVAIRGDSIRSHKLMKGYYKDIEVPEDAITDKIKATFKRKILNIKIPKVKRI